MWSKGIIELKRWDQTSISGCVLGSMAHMPLCLRSRHGTLWAIITCKAPTHNKCPKEFVSFVMNGWKVVNFK